MGYYLIAALNKNFKEANTQDQVQTNQPSGQQLIPSYYHDLKPSTVLTSQNFCQKLMSRENLYAVLIFNKFSGPTSLSFNIGQSFSGVHDNNTKFLSSSKIVLCIT